MSGRTGGRSGSGTNLPALRVLGLLGGVVALLLAAAWTFQDRLVYLPRGTAGSPADAGLSDAETVRLSTEDGLELEAWHVPAERRASATVLLLPGNAGNRSMRAPLARALRADGFAVLLVDYRGFGGNPGRPSAEGLLADARAARAHLRQRTDTGPVAYFGESLGAGVAVALAAEDPPAGLILRSPFTSLADVGAVHYPFLPVRLLLRDRFDVTGPLAGYDGPVLVVAGDNDRIVPTGQSREVAEAAGADLVLVPGAGHNDRALLDGDLLVEAVTRFLTRVATSGP